MDPVSVLKSGGFVVLRKETMAWGFWSHPNGEEFESNKGEMTEGEFIRSYGDLKVYDWDHDLMDDFLQALNEGWVPFRLYIYHRDLKDLPEELSEIDYISPSQNGFKAYTKDKELVCALPKLSGDYLYSVCGVPIQNENKF